MLGVQTTSADNVSARVKKAKANARLHGWIAAGNGFVIHGWKKRATGFELIERTPVG